MSFSLSRYTILFLVPVLLVPLAGRAQNEPWSGFGVDVNAIGGKVYKHEAKFTLPIPSLTTGLDVNLVQHTYGTKDWHQRRNYPTVGLAAAWINYGMDAVYGQCFGLYPNITLPLISGRKIEWTLRLGDGIGYVTREYRRTDPVNTTNVAIGSHINDFAMFMTDVRYHINTHWDVQLGANITHISDASYHKPNLGINMIGAHMGVAWYPVTAWPAHIVRDLKPLKNRWLVQATASMAYISSSTSGGPLYPVYLTSGYVSRRWKSKNKIFAGVDYAYYQSIYNYLRSNELYVGRERQNSWKSAVFAGNEFLLGRLGVIFQTGFYLQESAIKADRIYEKVGGHYYLVQREHGPIKEFFLSAFLKTHKSLAELGEVGFGVGF